MPRKSNTVKSECDKKGRRNCNKEDCVFIGKENMERWYNLKKRYNFLSDNEFASYLLDMFTNEKSCLQNKLVQKDTTTKQLESDQLDCSSSKVLLLQNNTNQVENISSVIVVNSSAVRGDTDQNTENGLEDADATPCSSSESAGTVISAHSAGELVSETITCSDQAKQKKHEKSSELQPMLVSETITCSDQAKQKKHEKSSELQPMLVSETITCSDQAKQKKHEKSSELQPMLVSETITCSDQAKQKKHEKSSELQPTLVSETITCSDQAKQKKHKKAKHNGAKETSTFEEERTSKHRKRKFKCYENSQHNDGAAADQESAPIMGMKSETCEPDVLVEPVELPCERVAITIKLCGDCELHHVQDACPLRQPIGLVSDSVSLGEWVAGRVRNDLVKCFAEASLPPCLELKVIDSQHGPSVVAAQNLQAFLQFGPLVGQPIAEREIPDDSTMEHIWELSDRTSCRYVTTSDANQSNWLRYIRPASVRSSRNLEVILRDDQLLFITTAAVSAGDELLFWMENSNSAWSHKKLCKTKCGGCNLSFSHTLYYRLHCSVFHDPAYSLTVRKYHCKVCGISVLGKENIVKHAADKHNGKGAYQCQFCHKFFLRLNYLEVHRTYGCSANPNRARPLCDYCGRKFCQPQKLKVHIKRMHSEMLEVLRDFQCKHCLKILGSRAALQRHFKEVHQKDVVGAFTCDRCGKMFQNKSNLKIHMLTHSGVKPFKCKESDCPAAFTTKQCLQFHYRKIHGLEEGCMPRIERSVEYTFDAYAGSRRPSSVNSDSQCSTDGEDTPGKYPHEDQSQLSPPISISSDQVTKAPLDTFNKMVVSKGSKKWMGEMTEGSRSNVFDFDDDDKEQDINVSQIEDEPVPMLFHHCKQDSANASLLVEAALDAAERDIDITSKVPSPVSLVTNKEVYPIFRTHLPHSPLSLSRPVSPVDYPIQEQSQSPHLAMESCYPTAVSPRHPYSLMFPERTPHYEFRLSPPPGPVDTFHLDESRYRREENSGDEGVNVAQNLSLGLKSKPLQLEIPYKYDALEERNFECGEGLDMSRTSGYHHSFVSMAPRYPHALYEPRTYSHADVLRVVNFSHSVDLSLPRSHHQLTPPMNQSLIEPIRIISPPPYQAYPLSTSPYNRPPHSPTYHPYNSTY